MKKLATCVLMLFVTRISAQVLSEAPAQHLDRTEWTLLAADAAARGLDVYSTHRASLGGGKDAELPGWIATHPPVMALYSGGVVAAQYYVARTLFRHHRQKWAYLLVAADAAQTAYAAGHNLSLTQKMR